MWNFIKNGMLLLHGFIRSRRLYVELVRHLPCASTPEEVRQLMAGSGKFKKNKKKSLICLVNT